MTGPTGYRAILRDAWQESAVPLPADSAVAVIRRGQTAVAAFCAGLLVLGIAPRLLSADPVGFALVAAVALVIGATLAFKDREAVGLVAAMSIAALVVQIRLHELGGEPPAAAWFDAAAFTAGVAMFTLMRSVSAVLTIAAIACASWVWVWAHWSLPGGWHTVAAWSFATIGLGASASFGTAIVRRGAVRLDRMTALAQAEASEREVTEASAREFFGTTRLLHDTFINTLSAISRGVPAARADELRNRCRQDLALIDSAVTPQLQPRRPVTPFELARDRAGALGLELSVAGDEMLFENVTDHVLRTAGAATLEALLNTSKHAGVQTATVSLVGERDAVILRVSDTGGGWSGPVPRDGGIAESILQRCHQSGIEVRIDSTPGRGTSITMRLPTQEDGPRRGASVFHSETRLMGLLACGAVMVDLGVRTLLTVGVFPALGPAVAYLLLVLAVACAWFAGRDRISPPSIACAGLALVGFPVMILLPTDATGSLSWAWWGSLAGYGIFVALIMLNAPAWWFLLAYLAQMAGRVVIDDAHPTNLLFPVALVLAVGAVACVLVRRRFFIMVSRFDAVAEQREAERTHALAQLALRDEGVRLLRTATTSARAPLEAIASGRVTGQEPEIRAECGALASYLRNVARVGPDLDQVGVRTLHLLAIAMDRGAVINLGVDPHLDLPDTDGAAALAGMIDALAGQIRSDDVWTVSLFAESPGGMFAVVSNRELPVGSGDRDRLTTAGITVDQAGVEDDYWIELRWTSVLSGRSHRPATSAA